MDPTPEIDLMTNRPHSARIYDYYLGGKTNYAADRVVGDQVLSTWPQIRATARANRAFMHRAVRHMASDLGIRQFLDIGTGIPTKPNLHEIAQSVAPDARVVYVDNDPIVLAHARALLVGTREGRTAYIDADVRDPRSILDAPELGGALDRSRPIALSLFSLVHFIEGEQAYDVVRTLVDALPSGSALALSSGTFDPATDADRGGIEAYRKNGIPLALRSPIEIERFFAGLRLLGPGVVKVHEWGSDQGLRAIRGGEKTDYVYGGVALKP